MFKSMFLSKAGGSVSAAEIPERPEPSPRVRNPLAEAIARHWFNRAANCGLKPKSMAYKRAEIEFAMGAAAAINWLCPHKADGESLSPMVPASWIFNVMRGVPVFERPDIRVLREAPNA